LVIGWIGKAHSPTQLIEAGIISIVYVKSNDNLVDPLTKVMSRDLARVTSVGMGQTLLLRESPIVGTRSRIDLI